MLTNVLSLSLWPFGLPFAFVLVGLLIVTFVLPLWASLRPIRRTQLVFVADPGVVIYVSLLGTLWLLHWSLLLVAASGLLLLLPPVSRRLSVPRPEGDAILQDFGGDAWPSVQQINAGRDALNQAQSQSSYPDFAALFIEERHAALIEEATSQIYGRWWDLRDRPALADTMSFLQTLPLRAAMITWQHHAVIQELGHQEIAIEDEDQLWTDLFTIQVQGADADANADAAVYVATMTDAAHAAREVLSPVLASLPADRALAAQTIAITTLRLLNDELNQNDTLIRDVADAWRGFETNAHELIFYALGHDADESNRIPGFVRQT